MVFCVDKQVLWLDVPMADTILVYVSKSATHLVGVQLDKDVGHTLVVLGVRLAYPVHNAVQKQVAGLQKCKGCLCMQTGLRDGTHAIIAS